MLWDDIQTKIEDGVGQECRTDGRFTPTRVRLLMHEIQAEIAEIVRCVEVTATGTTTASTEEYALPDTFLEAISLELSGYGALDQLPEKPIYTNKPEGRPCAFYLEGDDVGFDQTPDATYTYYLTHTARPPDYVFRITHEDGYSGSTACTMSVGTASIVLTITGGTHAGAETLTYASYTTAASMVTAINALSMGYTATVNDEATDETWAINGADVRDDLDLEGKVDYAFFKPKLRAEFLKLIVPGTIALLKLKDREITFEQYQDSAYMKQLYIKRNAWLRRNATANNQVMRNVYARRRTRGGNGSTYFVVN
ncbi:MAG: hypothetical protein GY833_16650 [Aestuariibacter sp.]|nr:hypothetical protein [Aestuariibacter sp.]